MQKGQAAVMWGGQDLQTDVFSPKSGLCLSGLCHPHRQLPFITRQCARQSLCHYFLTKVLHINDISSFYIRGNLCSKALSSLSKFT